jgi:uncharacterized membrane protein YgaE (UPF0421/DUF939 family)
LRLSRPALWRIAQVAIAAGVAWELARLIPGHRQPFFAPIAAVIALGAEVGRRGRQALRLVLGVALGIVIGAVVVVAAGVGAVQIVVAVFVAMTVGTVLGGKPVTTLQAAASATLVVALHRSGAGFALQRLVDALVGGGIAVLIAQLLFPADPLELLRGATGELREAIATSIEDVAFALESRDQPRVERALAQIDAIDERRLREVLGIAREVARDSPRRRRARRRVDAYDLAARELGAAAADAHSLATAALRILRGNRPPPPEAARAARFAAAAVRATSPTISQRCFDQARAASARTRELDEGIGSNLLAQSVEAIARHALGTVGAGDERHEPALLAASERHPAAQV